MNTHGLYPLSFSVEVGADDLMPQSEQILGLVDVVALAHV